MHLSGLTTRLRAVEPGDIDRMYAWENDPNIWHVSGTTTPFSRRQIELFVERQQTADIFATGQLRLIIETLDQPQPLGTLDLFEFDPINLRVGVGILIHDPAQRRHGYAADVIQTLCLYARDTLRLHQIWCSIAADNTPSRQLFLSAGFEPCGTRRDWIWQGNGYSDEVLMQKILH